MSKEFKGTHWSFTVAEEGLAFESGLIRPNKRFFIDCGILAVGYVGSVAVLAPYFAVGVTKKFRLLKMIPRALPLTAVAMKLDNLVGKWILNIDETDIQAWEDAKAYRDKLASAVDGEASEKPDRNRTGRVNDIPYPDGVSNKKSGRFPLTKENKEKLANAMAKQAVQEFKAKAKEIKKLDEAIEVFEWFMNDSKETKNENGKDDVTKFDISDGEEEE